MDTISLDFTYTKQQIVKAYRFHYNSTLHPKRDVIIALLLLIGSIYFINTNGFSYVYVVAIIASILLLAMMAFALYILPGICYKQNPKYKEEYHLKFTDKGIYFKTIEIESELSWAYYKKVRENNDFFLLYFSKKGFTVIPKNVFKSNGDLVAFTQFLETKIKAAGAG